MVMPSAVTFQPFLQNPGGRGEASLQSDNDMLWAIQSDSISQGFQFPFVLTGRLLNEQGFACFYDFGCNLEM